MDRIISLILLLASLQGIILSFALFFRERGRTENTLLSIALLIISLALAVAYLLSTDHSRYPYLVEITAPVVLIILPLVLLYAKILTGSISHISTLQLLHAIPFLFYMLYKSRFYFLDADAKISFFERVYVRNELLVPDIIEGEFLGAFGVVYGIWMFLVTTQYRTKVKNVFSEIETIKLSWLIVISGSILVLNLAAFIITNLQILEIDVPFVIHFLTAIGGSIFLYVAGYFTFYQPQLFYKNHVQLVHNIALLDQKPSTHKRHDEEKKYQDYLDKILDVTERKEIFRKSSLSIKEFAEMVHLPVYLISKVINKRLSENFFTFINKRRIREIKKALEDPNDKRTIIEIARDNGYISKSAFNSSFRFFTKTTPTAYRSQFNSKTIK